jgi:hypothetical protein
MPPVHLASKAGLERHPDDDCIALCRRFHLDAALTRPAWPSVVPKGPAEQC